MYMKCSKIVRPSSMNFVFAAILKDTKLSDRECALIGDMSVDTDDLIDSVTLVGLVEDRIRLYLENRYYYKAVLTCEDLRNRFEEWCMTHDVHTDNEENVWEWFAYEIEAKGIQVIQHPDPN